jgi:hypothetical protein
MDHDLVEQPFPQALLSDIGTEDRGGEPRDVMARMGHASTRAALIYQHADLVENVAATAPADGTPAGGHASPCCPPSGQQHQSSATRPTKARPDQSPHQTRGGSERGMVMGALQHNQRA